MYNLELFTAATEITEGTEGICYGLCGLCDLWAKNWLQSRFGAQKIDVA